MRCRYRICSLFQNLMSSKSPKSRFEHRPVRGMSARVESFCPACRMFIGASDKPGILKIAERAHICPERKRERPTAAIHRKSSESR